MEKMIFIAVCAVCGAAVVIAQAMRTGGGGNKNASSGANANAGGSTPVYTSGKPDLQSQLEESKKRLRDGSDKA